MESKIRDYINNTHLISQILSKKQKWHQFCVCMDLIGDTSLGLSQALKYDNHDYFFMYGTLELLYVQQDAIKCLHECMIDDKYKFPNEIKKIRNIRNDIAGHPANRNNEKYIFLHRVKLENDDFEINYSEWAGDTCLLNNPPNIKQANLKELIEIQKKVFDKKLSDLLVFIKNETKKSLDRFKGTNIVDLLERHSYYLGKIFESINKLDPQIGLHHLSMLKNIAIKYYGGLQERLLFDEKDKQEKIQLLFMLKSLQDFFGSGQKSKVDILTAKTNFAALQEEFTNIEENAIAYDKYIADILDDAL